VQEEIDRVVGKFRLVDMEDMPNLPYLEAVLKECMRFRAVGALALPHSTTDDSLLGDYHIPPKTQVLYHIGAVCRNPSIWKDPLKFDPSRFLREDISPFGADVRFIPFGIGRRVCPGNIFAYHEIFMWAGQVLQCFAFSSPTGPVSLEENWGLTIQPSPYDVKVSLRVSPQLLMPLPPIPHGTDTDTD